MEEQIKAFAKSIIDAGAILIFILASLATLLIIGSALKNMI